MTATVPFALPVEDVVLTEDAAFPGEVLSGRPTMSSAVLWASTERAVVRGVWQAEPGSFSWDFPRNETLVVLRGRARVTVTGGPVLTLGPGDVAAFKVGDRTVWEVTETLRKVFVVDSAA
ncbi:cupin domain-containing protein [Streptomyces sp. NPDC047046]|uniref:cupin domain-containing protein n=1 Tax=Streptomyces sp. NPDC047046 TaxID=3155378 RepID=UPI0033F25D4F